MKKIICILLCLCFALSLCACKEDETKKTSETASAIDVDLTKLSSTMVYSEVYNMMNEPSKYIGKKVKMNGVFAIYEGDAKVYFACVIADATACCQQGIEFELAGNKQYPDDYPQLGSEITVEGTFTTYKEADQLYCQLTNAKML